MSLDEAGQKRFLMYPPLQPLLLAQGAGHPPDPRRIFLMIALINCLTLGIGSVLLYRMATWNHRPLDGFGVCILAFSIVALGTIFTYHYESRPEITATLYLVAGLSVVFSAAFPFKELLLGLLLGLTGATHPAAAVTVGPLLGLGFWSQQPPRQAIGSWMKVVGLSILVFCGILSLSPFGLRDSLRGIYAHSQLAMTSTILPGTTLNWSLLRKYLFEPLAPFIGLVMLCFLFVIVDLTRRNETPWKRDLVSAVLIAAFCAAVWLFAMKAPARNYDAIMFTPLYLLLIVYYSVHKTHSFWRRALISGCVLLLASGLLRCALLYPVYLKHGLSFEAARNEFARLRTTQPSDTTYLMCGITWLFSEDYDHMIFCNQMDLVEALQEHKETPAVLIVQQNYYPLKSPPEIPGFHLIHDGFSTDVPRWGPIPLANKIPGYFFAAYLRNSPKT